MSGLSEFYETLCGFDPEFPSNETIDDSITCINQGYLPHPGLAGFATTVSADNFARFNVIYFNANSIGETQNTSNVLQNIITHDIGEF